MDPSTCWEDTLAPKLYLLSAFQVPDPWIHSNWSHLLRNIQLSTDFQGGHGLVSGRVTLGVTYVYLLRRSRLVEVRNHPAVSSPGPKTPTTTGDFCFFLIPRSAPCVVYILPTFWLILCFNYGNFLANIPVPWIPWEGKKIGKVKSH